jgi:hypothetical protein
MSLAKGSLGSDRGWGRRFSTLTLGAAICVMAVYLSTVLVTNYAGAELRGYSTPKCKRHVVVDYTRPFRRLEPAHPAPKSEVLPFAPRNLRITNTTSGNVLSGGGWFGYVLRATSASVAGMSLNWRVKVKLSQLTRTGRIQRVVKAKRWTFRTVHNLRSLDFSIDLSPKVALYRYVIEFQRLNGRRLAQFSEYVRAVKPRLRTELTLSANIYRTSDELRMQIVNPGTESVAYGEDLAVEMLSPTGWTPADVLRPIPLRKSLKTLGPGEAAQCEGRQFLSTAQVGQYRIKRMFSPLSMRGRRTLFEEFHIAE